MRSKSSAIYRSLMVGFAISALTGCAWTQHSFGEITNPGPSTVASAAADPDSSVSNPSKANDSWDERGFTYRGVKIELSRGEVTE